MKTIITITLFLFMMTDAWSQCESAFEYQQNELEILFTNISIAAEGETVDFVNWTMGDGEEIADAYEENFAYTYAVAGTYEVCLNILTSDFCEQESCQTIEIAACAASFSYENNAGTIFFIEDNSTALSDIMTYEWTVNGALESEDSYFYIGLEEPTNICLLISTSDGCESEYCMEIGEESICDPPTNLQVSSDSLFQIIATIDLAEDDPFYYYTMDVYDSDNFLIETINFENDSVVFDGYQFTPCDTFSVVAYANCGVILGNSVPTDTVEVVSLCYGCEVEISANQIGDYYMSFGDNITVVDFVESYTYTLDGEWVSDDGGFSLIVENGQEMCVTLETVGGCTDTDCVIVELAEPTCPSPEILSITENEFGDVTVTIEEVPEANSYTYEFYQNYGSFFSSLTASSQMGYQISETTYTFENTNMIPCSVYQVKVRSNCATQSGYYTPVANTISLCEDGCEIRFKYNTFANGITAFPLIGTQSEILGYEWTVDGIVHTGNNISLEQASLLTEFDNTGHFYCLEVFTADGCNPKHCEFYKLEYGYGCFPPIDISTISDESKVAIYFNGEQNNSGHEVRIINKEGDELYSILTEEEYVIIEVENLDKCEEYIVEVMSDCYSGGGYSIPARALFSFDCDDGCLAEFDFIGQGSGLINCINTSQSLDELSSYEWTIDGEFMSNEENPFLAIDELDGQEICLTIISDTDCSSQYCEFIQSSCPYTEIISLESNGPNQINLSVIEDDPSYAFEVLVFDTSGELLVSQNSLGPIVNIQNGSLSGCTEYFVQVIVKCQGGEQGFASAPQSIITECNNEYCPSVSDGSAYIENVSINGFENASSNDNGYGDYSSLMIPLILGEETALNLNPNFENDTLAQKFWVYADWDNDYVFSEEELIAESDWTTTAITLNINLPNSASSESTRLRIIMSSEENTQACGSYTIGETEDYSVILLDNSSDYCHANFNISYTENEVICTANAQTNEGLESLNWTVDGTSAGTSESINLNIENSQEICLHISNSNNCEDSYCQSIELACESNFSYQAADGVFEFEATEISSTNISSYEWTLDANMISEEKNFTYDLGISDGQEMCLTVNALGGCSASYCEEFSFACSAYFDYDIFNQTIFVTDESWSNGPTGEYELYWDFGDGESSTETWNTYHLYNLPAFYDLCLTITSPYGCEDTHCASISAGVECIEPQGIEIEVTENTLSATWEVFEGADAYRIELYEGFISVLVDTVQTNAVTIDSLLSCQDYVFRLGNLCGNENPHIDTYTTTECSNSIQNNSIHTAITNYPNPSNKSTTILFSADSKPTDLIISNIMGQVVEQHKIAPHTNQIAINTTDLPNGTYLYHLKNKSTTIGINKLLVLH